MFYLIQLIFICTLLNLASGQIIQCRYIPDKGYPCNGLRSTTNYYFHVASRTCQPFIYLGCGGNGNRFLSVDACNRVCKPGSTIINSPGINNVARPGNPPIGNGANPNTGNPPPIGGSAFPGRGNQMPNQPPQIGQGRNMNGQIPIGDGAFASRSFIGEGNSNQNGQPLIGQGTNGTFQPNLGQGAQPGNSMAQLPLIGGQRPVLFNHSSTLSATGPSTTINPMSMETTTQFFINGYAQMCDPTFAVVIDRPMVCGADDSCPQGFSCSGIYCCPTKQKVCSERYDSGKELEGKELEHVGRYAFNAASQQCNKFSYFGTGGNYNNFRSYNDCMQFCASSR